MRLLADTEIHRHRMLNIYSHRRGEACSSHHALHRRRSHGYYVQCPFCRQKRLLRAEHPEKVRKIQIPGGLRLNGKAVQFPNFNVFRGGLPIQQLWKGVFQHIRHCSRQSAPATPCLNSVSSRNRDQGQSTAYRCVFRKSGCIQVMPKA